MQKEIIVDAFEHELHALGIFTDYSKAFDRINHVTLLKKPERYGFIGFFLSLSTTLLYSTSSKACTLTTLIHALNHYCMAFLREAILAHCFTTYIQMTSLT